MVLIKKLKELISKDDLDEVFRILQNLRLKKDIYNRIVSNTARYNNVKIEYLQDIISQKDKNLTLNKLRIELLGIIDELENADITENDMLDSETTVDKAKEWLMGKLSSIEYEIIENLYECGERVDFQKTLIETNIKRLGYENIKISQNGIFEFIFSEFNENRTANKLNNETKKYIYTVPFNQLTDVKLFSIELKETEQMEENGFYIESVPDHHFTLELSAFNSVKYFTKKIRIDPKEGTGLESKINLVRIYVPDLEIGKRIQKCLNYLAKQFDAKKEVF